MKIRLVRFLRTNMLEIELAVQEGTTVREAVRQAGIEIQGHGIFINGEGASHDDVLSSNAELAITDPLAGG
jgi:putative ubiquitin-RnfH superfamily antitoxin RatB of RatAB toxin-antitoxin module